MKRFVLILIVMVMLFPVPALAEWPGADKERQIDALIAQVMKESRIPGTAVGIIEGENAVYLKGFGTAGASGRTVTPQTPFIIGSLSKSFTATAAMQQVAAGKLDLDAPVQQYLPWFRVADAAASAHMTVRHLLNHTSGLPRAAEGFLGMLDDRTTSEWIVRQLATVQLSAAPGERFEYSNLNYITAGLVVQTVAGVPLDRYIREQILSPLKMSHSFTSETAALADGLATGHLYYGTLPLARRAKYSRGRLAEGYVIASAEDMTRYLRAVMQGGTYEGATVLPEARLTEMLTPAVSMGAGAASYGMGWAISRPGGTLLWEHDGETPTFRSAMRILPEHSRGLIILANATADPTGGVVRLAGALTALLNDLQPGLAPAQVPVSTYVIMVVPPAILLWQVWDVIRLRRWGRRVRTRSMRWGGWALPALSLAVGLGCLVGFPVAYDAPPALMWAVFPHVAAAIFGAGALAVAAMVYRSLVLFRLRGRARENGLRQHADAGS